jgi:hypothetical protein
MEHIYAVNFRVIVEAAMSGRRLEYAVVAFLGALVASAGAADLSPPASSGQVPKSVPLRQRPPGSVIADHDIPDRGVRWGATFLGPSPAFPTDPSGVIGDTLRDGDHQFSPNWLTDR